MFGIYIYIEREICVAIYIYIYIYVGEDSVVLCKDKGICGVYTGE